MHINPLKDSENLRQHRNLTNSQQKNNLSTKEGVIVNNTVRDSENNLSSTKDLFMISDKVQLPDALYDNDNKILDKKLLPLSAVALGVMSCVAGLSWFVKRGAKTAKETASEKWLPAVTRNVNLNKETFQVIYQMVQSPSKKTFIAGTGVFALSAMAFMGKTFFDGFKEIWVKRKEANIQKNLQENLVAVETEAFAGKMQIIRSMLSKYTNDFEKYLSPKDERILQNFGRSVSKLQSFTGQKTKGQKDNSNFGNIMLGIGTTVGIVALGLLSLKNLTKSKNYLSENLTGAKNAIKEIVKTSSEATKETDKNNLEHMFMTIDGSENLEEFVTEQVKNLNWTNSEEKENFIKRIVTKIKTSTAKVNPNIGGDGTPKPAFNSFVDDYRAFFYNWLLDTNNPQFKYLFYGITAVSAISYGGKLAGDAIKEVQVKKINAETELDLQKRLVSTELRNFKSKKDAAIKPLVNEFYKQVDSGKRTKSELKTVAENVLFEIKNGPPYVYS